jgi:outer membrane protein OmpA-like peptidoglycan-associated protein
MKLSNIQSAMKWSLTSVALVGIISVANPVFGQKDKKKGNKVTTEENNSEIINYVSNGSFETLIDKKKPKKLGAISTVEDWFSPTGVKADVYREDLNSILDSKKSRPLIGVPMNSFGKEDPQEGKSYVGISAYLTGKKQNERSYITGALNQKLEKNKTYCIEFWVSLAEGSKYACNNIGIKFDQKRPDEAADKQLAKGNVDVLHPENKVVNSANGWFKICGTYVAKGGEQYITIGNFEPNAKTTNEPFKQSKQSKATAIQAAYYFIDNVIVRDYYESFDAYLAYKKVNADDLQDDLRKIYEKNYDTLGKCQCFTKAVIDTDTTYSKLTYQKDFIIEDRMKPEEKIQTYQVYFAAGSSKLSSEANTTLDEIAKILNANSAFKLKVVGHADTEEFNLSSTKKPEYADVDKKRAEAVKEKLTALGVKNAITIDSKAASVESDSVSGESDEKELDWAKNRRVEFFIEK